MADYLTILSEAAGAVHAEPVSFGFIDAALEFLDAVPA